MYCPRCNLHSEEYVDKCPLCAGPMEFDDVGSGAMKTPTVPEKVNTDNFPKEESLGISEQGFGDEAGDLGLSSRLELEQEKIVSETQKKTSQEEEFEFDIDNKEKTPAGYKEEYSFDREEQLYQQQIRPLSKKARGKKKFPFFMTGMLILFLLGGGYFFFYQPDVTPLLKHVKQVKVLLTEQMSKISTYFKTWSSSPPPTAQVKKKAPEPLMTQPENLPLPTETTESVQIENQKKELSVTDQGNTPQPIAKGAESDSGKLAEATAANVKKPEVTKSETMKSESKEPVASLKPPEVPVAQPEPKKKEITSQVVPGPLKSQKKTKKIDLPASDAKGQYSILVGSFKVEANALDLKNTLQGKGYPVTIYSIDLPGKGSWYRVIVGNYTDLQETRKVASKLKTEEKIPALLMKGDKYL